MEDRQLIALFFARDERAVEEVADKYGKYCFTVASNILQSREDTEECVNDTWLKAWNSIPPHKPNCLRAFLAKLTRSSALDRYRAAGAAKRGGGRVAEALDELSDCIPGTQNVEQYCVNREMQKTVKCFLHKLPERECNIFLRRYFFMDETAEIAARYSMTEGAVLKTLSRTRLKLRLMLQKELDDENGTAV